MITEVELDAPGARAGLRSGDVIIELDGKPVTDAGQLQMTVGQRHPGETVHLQVVRDSKQMSIAVRLEALGGDKGATTAGGERGKGRWGLSLADLTPDVRNELQAQALVHGAIVEDVQPGSPADKSNGGSTFRVLHPAQG